MNIKLALIFGVLIWILTCIFTSIFDSIFGNNVLPTTIAIPIIIIILIVFFGILYIRNFNSNEVIEGMTCGIIFVLVDIVLDMAVFIIPHVQTQIIQSYPVHVLMMTIMTLLITTFLGYLAQMNIDLK